MEQEKTPEQTAAEQAEAEQKRQEAVRKVEQMLENSRRKDVETRLNILGAFSRHPTTYIVKSEKEELDPMSGLLQYQKPQGEMTQAERETEQKREEAIRKINTMLIEKRGNSELLDSRSSVKTVYLPKARKPVEKNSVDIAGFLSQYQLSPEAQERFEEIRYGGAKKGTVRPSLLVRFGSVAASLMLLFTAWVLGQFQSLSVMKPVFIILAVLLLFGAYYANTWKLEFDRNSEFVRYHSLFHGTNLYEMKELMAFSISPQPEKPFPFSLLGMLDPRQYLVIRLPDHTLNIPLLFSATVLIQTVEIDGYEGAGDLCRCLEQYERDLYKKAAGSDPQKPAAPAESASVQASTSAPDKKPAIPKPAKTAAEPPEPKPAPVDPEQAREMFAKPAESALSMPERGNAFPDPTQNSAFPDPTRKPDVDVDALFNQVLREHGKLK